VLSIYYVDACLSNRPVELKAFPKLQWQVLFGDIERSDRVMEKTVGMILGGLGNTDQQIGKFDK
jgi:hypothetical protein